MIPSHTDYAGCVQFDPVVMVDPFFSNVCILTFVSFLNCLRLTRIISTRAVDPDPGFFGGRSRLKPPGSATLNFQPISKIFLQAVMFHVMPSYTDILGASLVLGTVVTITFEKQISSGSCCCCDKPADKSVHDETDATFKARSVSLSSAEKGGKAELAETEELKGSSTANYNSSNTFSHLSDDCDDEHEKN